MPNVPSMHAKLVKADYHGAIVTGRPVISFHLTFTSREMHAIVKDAKNNCLIGCSGIVIHETECTFKVVTRSNQVKGKIVGLYV